MRSPAEIALAEALRYPTEGLAARVEAGLTAMASSCPAAARAFEPFVSFASTARTEELEELYTRTFDLNPAATLETGWHLYGERYERGAFLARMRSILATHQVSEEGELPDHLCPALVLMGRMDKGQASRLAREVFLPAVRKIIIAIEVGNPYRGVLLAVEAALEERLSAIPGGTR